MNTKTSTYVYWAITILFALWLVFDGIGGILGIQAGKDSLLHLGYPLYLLAPIGLAKLLAAAAILQTRFRTIKEWAFAGYAINCLGAFVSRLAIGDSITLTLAPLVFLAIMLIPYILWKKRLRESGRSA